jgi:ADP-ribosylglycohydrolase
MRVAPLGAYFAGDLERCLAEARTSSVVTHTHPEGAAGAIAVAVAAAMAWRLREVPKPERADPFFDEILRLTPESQVRRKTLIAKSTPANTPVEAVARMLGCGELVTAPDTVPFCVWVAAHHLDNFANALAQTISVGGDCDTNAAIVGGIVALSVGRGGIPVSWLEAREPIQF